jgi:hypothetical protein
MTFAEHVAGIFARAMQAKELVFQSQDALSTLQYEQSNGGAPRHGVPLATPSRRELACSARIDRELRRARAALEAVDRAVMAARCDAHAHAERSAAQVRELGRAAGGFAATHYTCDGCGGRFALASLTPSNRTQSRKRCSECSERDGAR